MYKGGPILDGTARIQVFEFGEYCDLRVGVQVPDFHQGGVADGIDDGVADGVSLFHRVSYSLFPCRYLFGFNKRRVRIEKTCSRTLSSPCAASTS